MYLSFRGIPTRLSIIDLSYGAVCYLVFFATFLYAVGFVGNIFVPKSLDSGMVEPLSKSLLINCGLLAMLVVQKVVMTRPWFKQRWARFFPELVESGIDMLMACLLLLLLFRQWRPMPGVIWLVESTEGRFLLWVLFSLGWMATLVGAFLIIQFDLCGPRQFFPRSLGKTHSRRNVNSRVYYGPAHLVVVVGLIAAVWATPRMTLGHLLFAAVTTVGLHAGVHYARRDDVSIRAMDTRRSERSMPMLSH